MDSSRLITHEPKSLETLNLYYSHSFNNSTMPFNIHDSPTSQQTFLLIFQLGPFVRCYQNVAVHSLNFLKKKQKKKFFVIFFISLNLIYIYFF